MQGKKSKLKSRFELRNKTVFVYDINVSVDNPKEFTNS